MVVKSCRVQQLCKGVQENAHFADRCRNTCASDDRRYLRYSIYSFVEYALRKLSMAIRLYAWLNHSRHIGISPIIIMVTMWLSSLSFTTQNTRIHIIYIYVCCSLLSIFPIAFAYFASFIALNMSKNDREKEKQT